MTKYDKKTSIKQLFVQSAVLFKRDWHMHLLMPALFAVIEYVWPENKGFSFLGTFMFLISAFYVSYRVRDIQPYGKDVSQKMFKMGIWFRLFILDLLYALGVVILGLLGGIPGFIFAVYFIFVTQAMYLGKKGIWESFRYSYSLVKGNWWHSFKIMLVFGIAFACFCLIAAYIPWQWGTAFLIYTLVAYWNVFSTYWYIERGGANEL